MSSEACGDSEERDDIEERGDIEQECALMSCEAISLSASCTKPTTSTCFLWPKNNNLFYTTKNFLRGGDDAGNIDKKAFFICSDQHDIKKLSKCLTYNKKTEKSLKIYILGTKYLGTNQIYLY